MKRTAHALWLFGLLLTASAEAAVSPFTRGFDTVPLKITPTRYAGLILDGAEMPLVGSMSFAAVLDGNVSIMALKLGHDYLGQLIPFRIDARLQATYQLLSWLELSGELPFTVGQIQNFGLLADNGFPQTAPAPGGIGDLRFLGRLQALNPRSAIFGLAGVLEVRLPTGDGNSFMGDAGLVFAPRFVAEKSFGPLKILGNLGWKLRTYPGQFLNLYVGQEFTFGAGAQWELPDYGRFTQNTALFEINMSTAAEAPFTLAYADAMKTPLEAMIGFRSTFNDTMSFQLALGRGLAGQTGYGREAFRFVLGFRYAFDTAPDGDNDGVPDKVDRCPTEPETVNGVDDADGCPDYAPDSDGDGTPDNKDGCVYEPGPQEYDGCPDRDGDQIPDNVDKCPDEFGVPEREGCPAPPDEPQVVLESDRIRVNNNVLFETAQAIIQPQSFSMLDGVAKVLRDNPDVGPVLIEGHTDNRGSRPYNLDLSQRRAKAVENYFVSKGIHRKRLRSQGFGFDRPVATNETPLGRAKNRRTDFRLVDEDSPSEESETPPAAPTPASPAAEAATPVSPAPAPPPAVDGGTPAP
ncbi:MAG: OmpA family protein [Myxococcaceae bacterium]|nr:OmpA family protein [Myxococcaceae bacterium]